jgi:uncharacterized protein YyaL (SSP411 family)
MQQRKLALAILLTCVLGSAADLLRAEDDKVFWYSNYKEGLEEAQKTGKPIFLEYRCEA